MRNKMTGGYWPCFIQISIVFAQFMSKSHSKVTKDEISTSVSIVERDGYFYPNLYEKELCCNENECLGSFLAAGKANKGDPLIATLLLAAAIQLQEQKQYEAFKPSSTLQSVSLSSLNHPELVPINPYIALLLSHYGKYTPKHGRGGGLYSYTASNNYHNNKPFGAYKIYEDTDGY